MAPTASRMSAYAVTSRTGSTVCSWRARRSVSRPEMPGMRTSEIIMLNSAPRRTSNACSPDATGAVSKPWLFKNESSRLRWPGSSSTMRMRGPFTFVLSVTDCISSAYGREPQVGDAENRAPRLVRSAFNLPTVRQDDLLNHRQPQPGAFLVRGEIRFKDFGPMLRRNTRAVVTNLQEDPLRILFPRRHFDVPAPLHCLNSVDQEIEQRLPEQLFIRFDHRQRFRHLQPNALFLQIVAQGSNHLANDQTQRDRRATDFTWPGAIDELIELRSDPIRLVDDITGATPNFRRCIPLFRNHLSEATNDVQRIARFVGQPGRRQIHFFQVCVQFAGADEPHLKLGRLEEVAPRQAQPHNGDAGEAAYDQAQPKILLACLGECLGGHHQNQAVQSPSLDQRFSFLLASPGWSPEPRSLRTSFRPVRRGCFARVDIAGRWRIG